MGNCKCWCSRSQPEGDYPLSERTPSERSIESCHSEPPKCLQSNVTFQRSLSYEGDLQISQDSHYKHGVVKGTNCNPKLECFIIPSFGKDPPGNVVPKKATNDFLKGVGDDFKIIQDLIGKDEQKELGRVQLMCHFEQVKLAKFKHTIEERMKDLKLKSSDNGREGLLIWYTGHGERETGNWVLEDGCLAFEDIYNLYMRYFLGRCLYIVTDCCYSGSWVKDCAQLLDRDGLMCAHDTKREKVYIKVFAACLPNEQAWDKFYTDCRGIKLHSKGPHRTIVFAEHRKLEHKSGKGSQTTLGVDFTQTGQRQCITGENEKCHGLISWTELVQHLSEAKSTKNYLI